MRRLLNIALLVLLFMLPASHVKSQLIVDNSHYVTLSLGGTYNNFMHKVPNAESLGGPGGFLGVGWEFNYNGFLLNAGFDINFRQSITRMNNYDFALDGLDTEKHAMRYHYTFNQFEDRLNVSYVSIPIAVGYYNKHIYTSVGVKVGMSIFAESSTSATYSTRGEYKELIDNLTGMPDHYFGSYTAEGRAPIAPHYNVDLIAELGYNIPMGIEKHKANLLMRVGLYAEYGLMPPKTTGEIQSLVIENPSNLSQINLNSFYSTFSASQYTINPFQVGVKFTLFFRVPPQPTCYCIHGMTSAKKK